MTEKLDQTTETEFLGQLVADMDRLGARPYAEIGVPMFLVAEDRTKTLKASGPEIVLTKGAAPASEDGARIASLFTEAAEALAFRTPELEAKDIARLVETIADRHFLGFSGDEFSKVGEFSKKDT